MLGLIARFWKDRSGATAIEYGLIGVLVAVAIITGASALGTATNTMLHNVGTSVSSVSAAS